MLSHPWSIVAAMTLLAAALRFPFLGHQSFWYDEVYTREILREQSFTGVWDHVRQTESTPPLYYLLAWLVKARSAAAMRAIPAIALTASVPAGYLAFRRLIGTGPALAGAAILAVNPMLVSYSTDARSYGLLVLTALLSVWAWSCLLERPSLRRYGLWALACLSCLWTHYFAAFLVAGEGGILLARLRNERRATLGCLCAILACASPLLPLALHQASDGRAAFIEGDPLVSRVLSTVRQFAMGANVPRTWLEAAGLGLWTVAVGAGAVSAMCRRDGERALLLLFAASVGLPLLATAVGAGGHFDPRNVIFAMPIAAALAGPVMLRLGAAPLCCYLVAALACSLWVATDWRYQQVDWRDAISRVETIDPGIPIVAASANGGLVAGAYLQGRAVPVAGLETTSAWVIVAPGHGPHDRALVPSPVPVLPGFRIARELFAYGFRLLFAVAPRATRIAAGEIPDSTLFSAACDQVKHGPGSRCATAPFDRH